MKENYRHLQLLIRLGVVNPEDFFCITFYSWGIQFMGNSNIIEKYSKYGVFEKTLAPDQVAFKRGIIEFTACL